MRKAHIIKHNKASKFFSKILFYDTETKGEKEYAGIINHRFLYASTCFVKDSNFNELDVSTKNVFDNIEDFWNYVVSKTAEKTTLALISHNQNWDFIAVNGFEELVKRDWELTGAIIDKDVWIVRFRKNNRRIVVYDSFNWFKFSVKEMGETIKLAKQEIDFDTCTKNELIEYCMNDTMILTKFFGEWINFLKKHDFGNFKPTIASQAFSCYTHRFMKHKIYIHTNQSVINLERESFRGATNVCFRLGQFIEEINYLDVVSMHPNEMQKNYFPVRLVGHYYTITRKKLIELMKKYAVIARVKIQINQPAIALKREKLLFPTGIFTVTLTSPEIEHILKNGKILHVYECAIYEQEKIFTDYVDYFIKLKLKYAAEENITYEKISKMLLNSLYGRFGLKIHDKIIIDTCPVHEISEELHYFSRTKELKRIIKFGGKVFECKKDFREGNNSFAAIPSFVSAFARIKIWQMINTAGTENCFYTDTDCVFVNEKGFQKLEHLINPLQLGMLKIQEKAKRLNLFGCKDYELDDKVKIKGIKKNAIKLAEGLYQQEQFLKIKSLLRLGRLDTPMIRIVIKNLKRNYDKGTVLDNGRVIPFVLNE